MTAGRRANVPASVLARLRELARRDRVEFQVILSEFAIERLLYRLGASRHADAFVLKGATLFRLWSTERGRATWDLDLLGRVGADVEDTISVVRELCAAEAEDSIAFVADSIRGEEIRDPEGYGGVRVRLEARLAEAQIPVQLDVGFGDAVVPTPRREAFPTLLDHAPPEILVYPREAVVAEKLEALVALGVTNSRMKDFYDLHQLCSVWMFDGAVLVRAVRATFGRRGTELPASEPPALAIGFLGAPERRTQWQALLRRGRLAGPPDAEQVSERLRAFLLPLLEAASHGDPFEQTWPPGGPWQP